MKRLNVVLSIRTLLLIGSLVVAAPLLGGCALEGSGGTDQSANEPGTDDFVDGAEGDPALVYNGTGGNLAVQQNHGVSLPSQLPIVEDDGRNGPQPEPWQYTLSLRSAGQPSSGDNHK